MPVTHSPGNPFAFTPARTSNLSYGSNTPEFRHYRSPIAAKREQREVSEIELEKVTYDFNEYKEQIARESVVKDSRIEELERRIIDESKKTERAESDKRFLFDLQTKQAAELTTLRNEIADSKTTESANLKELRNANAKLKEQLIALEDSRRADHHAQARELDNVQSSLDSQRRAMDTLKADLTNKNDMIAEKNNIINTLELRVEQLSMTAADGNAEDLSFVTKELAVALSKVTSLETANAAQVAKIHGLQDANLTLSTVSEAKLALEHKLKMMDEMRDAFAIAEVKLAALEKERATWADLLEGSEEQDIGAILQRQKRETDTLRTEMKILEQQLNDSNVTCGSLRNELNSLKADAEQNKVEVVNEARARARLERSKAMSNREITFLREQLKSFDLEEQLESPNFDALRSQRIEELEKMLDECRAQLLQVTEKEEDKLVLGMKRGREETDFNDIERGEYLRKIRSLNSELEITKTEVAVLQKELQALKAERAGPTSRILQHKDNPTLKFQAIRTQTLQDLKTENAALLASLSGKGTVVTVPIQSLRNAESESRRLEAEIRQREKMIERLKSVFSAKSSEFREAVYSLLGYKLDFLPNGRVRLTSTTAGGGTAARQTAFVFDGEAGTMQLCRDDDDDDEKDDKPDPAVDNLIRFWSSGEKQSIPGMLSALTLELLER